MTSKTVKLVLDSIRRDYDNFLEKANTLANNSLVDRTAKYKFYEKNIDENIDFDNQKIGFGKITGVTVTSDKDILFDITDNFTKEKLIMFSCDILNIEG